MNNTVNESCENQEIKFHICEIENSGTIIGKALDPYCYLNSEFGKKIKVQIKVPEHLKDRDEFKMFINVLKTCTMKVLSYEKQRKLLCIETEHVPLFDSNKIDEMHDFFHSNRISAIITKTEQWGIDSSRISVFTLNKIFFAWIQMNKEYINAYTRRHINRIIFEIYFDDMDISVIKNKKGNVK